MTQSKQTQNITEEERIFKARNITQRIFNSTHEDGIDFDFISAGTNNFGAGDISTDIEIDCNDPASGKIFPAFFRENATIRHIAPTINPGGFPTIRIGIRFHGI